MSGIGYGDGNGVEDVGVLGVSAHLSASSHDTGEVVVALKGFNGVTSHWDDGLSTQTLLVCILCNNETSLA